MGRGCFYTYIWTGQKTHLTGKYRVETEVQDRHRTMCRYLNWSHNCVISLLPMWLLIGQFWVWPITMQNIDATQHQHPTMVSFTQSKLKWVVFILLFSYRVCTESVAPNLGYSSYVRPLRSRKTKLTLVTSHHMTSPLFSSIFSKRYNKFFDRFLFK